LTYSFTFFLSRHKYKQNTDTLNLDAAGLSSDKRGLLDVNSFYQTTNPNIYAAGDCIGSPALASTSMEQGRRAR